MSRNSREHRTGMFSVRPEPVYVAERVPAFQALIASPAHGAFEMPADAQIAILARGGDCLGCPLVTLTKPGWNPRVIAAPGMNPGQRSVIAGVVRRGTLVEAGPGGLEVQILHDEQWKTIARG
jgi:hypothetical protein